MCAGNCISKKFILINRECELISGLLGAGLTDLRRVHRSTAFYYCAFYSLSIGLERLMKLILLLQNNGKINLKKYKHDLLTLSKDINISFEHESIEYAILKFLHKFATKGRYRIPDALHLGYIDNVNDEPIKEFYNNIGIKIKNKHQIKKKIHLPEHISEYIYTFCT